MTSRSSSPKTIIYYNDSTDSDNMAAALALCNYTMNDPTTQVLWILEPRQVALSLRSCKDDVDACKELIKRHFPDRGNSFKTLLGGLLTKKEIDRIQGLSKKQLDLVGDSISHLASATN